jgi:lysozyme
MPIDVVIDLSHHNVITDWTAIRNAGIHAVLHKASQGTTFVDKTYHERRRQALDSGLLFGAYHFGEAGPALPQVSHFLDTVQPEPGDLLVLDFEPCAQTMTQEGAELFVDEVYVRTGQWCGLYSGMSFCGETMGTCTDTPLARSWLWLARYSTTPPVVPPAWTTWTLWQFCDDGTIPGIEGAVDIDRFNGSIAQLYRLWGVPSPTTLA